MRTTALGFAIAALCACVAFGQTPAPKTQQQAFTFKHTDTVQNFQEVCNLIRTVTEIKDVSTDNDLKALTLRGTADQLELAGWLVKELDRDRPSQDSTVREYRAGSDDVVHLYYLNNAATMQEFQEIANVVRTATQIRIAFTYNSARAFGVRGTGDQIALADWLVSDLGKPANAQSPGRHEYQIHLSKSDAERFGDTVRIFYLSNLNTVQDFQEVANLVRTATKIRAAFTYYGARALTLRGTGDELALADWLIKELNTNGQDEYRIPNTSDEAVRVVYLPHAATVQDFQDKAKAIRSATNIPSVFTYSAQRAVALRGTVAQIELAERLAQDLDQPK